ncbi:MAG: SCO family protein [Acidobacteria bacterium]|nr:SCO family protein [Acidobacteriota bacterium]
MQNVVAAAGAQTEPQFAALVDALAADPSRRGQLTELLREDHPLYDQRGTATTVRMRGWVLLALARVGVSDAALLFVFEELDTGTDAYLVAAAARALRSYPNPDAAFAPFLVRALANIRYHEEPVSFDSYGEYAASTAGTSPVRELLATLAWLGPHARGVLREVESLRAPRGGLPKKLMIHVDAAVAAIRGDEQSDAPGPDACCALPGGLRGAFSWARGSRRGCGPIAQTVFEDQEGGSITFEEFFRGHPTVVVFFYTRCDNPLKCSLTVTKLARVQKLLEARGLAGRIHTAAITYDPAFDLPARLRGYGQDRGVRMDARHRMLRATDGIAALRNHFRLGVNFIESLVNRHRVEAYVLDAEGRVAASFERIRWDEQQVVDRALEVLEEKSGETTPDGPPGIEAIPDGPPETATRPAGRRAARTAFGTLASLGVAFFPKCPICWAGYASVLGLGGLWQIPYSPWLQPLLAAVMLINLTSVWLRGRATGRMSGFYLVSAGALALVVSKLGPGWGNAAACGVALTFAGSLLSALGPKNGLRQRREHLSPR